MFNIADTANECDGDCNGELPPTIMENTLGQPGWKKFDADKSGTINKEEFVQMMKDVIEL